MKLTGIEIVNAEEGEIRAVECKGTRNRFVLCNGVQAVFGKPFTTITPAELKAFFKRSGISLNNVLLILPENAYKYTLWADEADSAASPVEALGMMSAYVEQNRAELGITGSVLVKKSFTGMAGAKCCGIITMAHSAVLEGYYQVFKGFNLNYVLPSVSAYALLGYGKGKAGEFIGILDLTEDTLTFAVYHMGVLAWMASLPCCTHHGSNSAVYDSALRALNTARGNRLYPSKILLTGVIAENTGISKKMSETLEIECQVHRYEYGGSRASAGLSTLIGAVKGVCCGSH